jgi:hypothetical protein
MFLNITMEGDKYRVEKLAHDGRFLVSYVGEPSAKMAKALGIPEAIVYRLVTQVGKFDLMELPACKFHIRKETSGEKKEYPDFTSAYAAASTGWVIEWDELQVCCCFDLDDHQMSVATAQDNLRYHSMIWTSMSGEGFHAIYHAAGGYAAIELAAMDAYRLQVKYPDAKIELLPRTRMPPVKSQAIYCEPKPVAEFTSAGTWLEDKGYKVGQRLAHTDCPVTPSPRSMKNPGPPVVLRDHYVHCYICESDGIRMGSKNPGRFPYSVLSGDTRPTQLSLIVDNLTHYGHAKHSVYVIGIEEPIAKNLYSGLLKCKHGVDDPRIPAVFTAGEPVGLVRQSGYWTDENGVSLKLGKDSPVLKSLPTAQTIDRRGVPSLCPTNLEWLTHPIDLTRLGYLPVVPLYGIQITQFQSTDIRKTYRVRQGVNPPKYLPQEKRLPELEAWNEIESIFPRINRTAIEALIVGRGCSEARVGLPPMLFFTGNTGVGKTSLTMVAAAICGDSSTPVFLNRERDRFNNAFLAAKSKSGFVFFDEFFKFAKQASLSDVEAMESLTLGMQTNAQAYVIYIGTVPMGDLPFMIWGDTTIPDEVAKHEQVGRRVHHMHLVETLEWEGPLADFGIYEYTNLRSHGSVRLRLALDSILSWVMDRWFTGPPTDFAVVMKELGVKRILDGELIQAKNELLKEFYAAVCKAPAMKDVSDIKRFSGPGWKVIRSDAGNDPLFTLFELLQTEEERAARGGKCRALFETPLRKALGKKHEILFEMRTHGRKYAMRFISTDKKQTNGEIQ